MASDLYPLDIMYNEVNDWLVNRRKIPNDWLKRLQLLQKNITKASKSLPSGFLSQFNISDNDEINYDITKKIRDRLLETAERGYFGGLSGSANDWDKFFRAYEKSNLYLSEAAQVLKLI